MPFSKSLAVSGVLASLAFCAPAFAKTAIVTQETPACMSWAGWHEWVQASLTAKGAGFNNNCPTAIGKGTKVEFVEDDDDGAAVIRWRDKTWFTHGERLSVTQ